MRVEKPTKKGSIKKLLQTEIEDEDDVEMTPREKRFKTALDLVLSLSLPSFPPLEKLILIPLPDNNSTKRSQAFFHPTPGVENHKS